MLRKFGIYLTNYGLTNLLLSLTGSSLCRSHCRITGTCPIFQRGPKRVLSILYGLVYNLTDIVIKAERYSIKFKITQRIVNKYCSPFQNANSDVVLLDGQLSRQLDGFLQLNNIAGQRIILRLGSGRRRCCCCWLRHWLRFSLADFAWF